MAQSFVLFDKKKKITFAFMVLLKPDNKCIQ